jgi:glycosyltransferase involved in cell wall biosynthesis
MELFINRMKNTKKYMSKLNAIIIAESFDDHGLGLPKAALRFSENLPRDITIRASISFQKFGIASEGLNQIFTPGNRISKMLLWPTGLLNIIKDIKPDIVHFHGIWTAAICAIPIARKMGCKVIVSPHGQLDTEVMRNHWLRKRILFHSMFRMAMAEANIIHALNLHEKSRVNYYLGAKSVVVIPNGIDIPADITNKKDLAIIRILFCGQFHKRKNILRLLHAWKNCNNMISSELHIAGDGIGNYADLVKSEMKVLPRVFYHGYVSGLAKDMLYKSCHFGILTSRGEGQPLAVLESLAYGNPCIITEECRLPAVNNLNMGWVVSNDLELETAIISASSIGLSYYEEMSRRGRQYIHHHHRWDRVGTSMGQVYHGLDKGAVI